LAAMAAAALLAPLALACGRPDGTLTRWGRSGGRCAPGAAARPPPPPAPTAAPPGGGLADPPLEALGQSFARGELGNLPAVLVVRDGRLVFERYRAGRAPAGGARRAGGL